LRPELSAGAASSPQSEIFRQFVLFVIGAGWSGGKKFEAACSKIAAGKANSFYSAAPTGGADMFGKPQWFRAKTFGWGLVPVAWQGWIYTAGWVTAIGLPFLLLIGRHPALEAMAWMG